MSLATPNGSISAAPFARTYKAPILQLLVLLGLCLPMFPQAVGTPNYIETGGEGQDIVYDPGRHLLYVSLRGQAINIPDNNQIKVISTDTQSVVDTIHVPNPQGMDISPDGSMLLVGSMFNEYLRVVDLNTRKVISRFNGFKGEFSPLIPSNVVALKNGKAIVYAGEIVDAGFGAWFYGDYRTGQFTKLSVNAPFSMLAVQVAVVRSADGSKAFFEIDHSYPGSGGLAIFDADSGTVSASSGIAGFFPHLTANADGTRFAACCDGFNTYLFDTSLNKLGTYNYHNSAPTTAIYGLNFSRDGSALYLQEVNSQTSLQGFAPQVVTIDANTMVATHTAASVLLTNNQSNNGQSFYSLSRPLAVDDQGRTYGLADHGIIVDFPGNAPSTTFPASVDDTFAPALGAPGSTATLNAFLRNRTLIGVSFGSAPANVVSVIQPVQAPSAVVTVRAPAGTGTVNVNTLFSDGWFSILPNAFSYSPSIQHLLSTGGPLQGGNVIEIIGYGFGDDASALHFTFGGRQGTVNSISRLFGTDYSLSPVITPYRTVQITVPAGVGPGPVDVTVTTPYGSQTKALAYSYINATLTPRPGHLGHPIFDRFRNRVYLTNSWPGIPGDRIEVFDVASRTFLAPIITGPSIYHVGLTPDGQHLLTATNEKQVLVINPDTRSIQRFSSMAPGDDPNYDRGETHIVGITNGRALLANPLASCQHIARLIDVNTGQLTELDQTGLPCLGGDIFSNDDGTKVLFAQEGGTGAELNVWDFSADTAFGRTTNEFGEAGVSEGNISGDGNRMISGPRIFGPDLSVETWITFDHEFEHRGRVFGAHLNPPGSLAYTPTVDGFVISDANTGEIFSIYDLLEDTFFGFNDTNSEALDPIGHHLFVISVSGLTTVDLPLEPLTIGWVNPSQVAVGDTALVRGSGFQSGASVTVDGLDASAQFVDMSTLRITAPFLSGGTHLVTVNNPDGNSYTVPSALSFAQRADVPHVDSLSPAALAVGDGVLFVNVAGSNFTPATQAYAGHRALATTFVSASELQVERPVNSFLNIGFTPVFVITPGPGGGRSNVVNFTLINPVPVISNATSVLFQNVSTIIVVNGMYLAPNTVVRINGQDRQTTSNFGYPVAQLLPSDVATVGNLLVTAFNPAPGGGESNALSIPVQPAFANPFFNTPRDFGTVLKNNRRVISMTFSNFGQAPWNITSIDLPPGVDQTNNCQGVRFPSECVMTIGFKGDTLGPWTGTLVIHGNVAGNTTSVRLLANVFDFQLGMMRPQRPSRNGGVAVHAVTAGQAVVVEATLSSNGATADPVSLTCSVAPTNASCSVTPGKVTLQANDLPLSVTLTTSARRLDRADRLTSSRHRTGTPAGNYSLYLSATIGTVSKTLVIPVTVQ